MKLLLFLRKIKIFNKSRYSRNRQNTRVAFYLSIFINILVIFVVFSLYYKILFKLTVMWWFFFLFLLLFILGGYLRAIPTTSFKGIVNFFKTLLKK